MTKATVIHRASDTLALEYGETIQAFGRSMVWNEHCVRREESLRWRSEGDPLCDEAIKQLFAAKSSTGVDLLDRLESSVSPASGMEKAATSAQNLFWKAINDDPPDNIRATEKQIELARSFFLDHSVQIMQALLYYSLAGGFASARIVRTLNKVSYLVSPNEEHASSQATKDRTFRRLLETFQFVLEVMRCVVPLPEKQGYLLPGGDGWKAIIRVRMLHAVARARAQGKDRNPNDIPINQEDMNGTLASFSTVPIWALRTLGLDPSREEAEAYLAVWRHIGFYLGVSSSSLSQHFQNIDVVDQYLKSATLHLFLDDEELDDDTFVPPTMAMLEAVSGQPPYQSGMEYNCAVTRYLLGQELADHLHVPPTTWRMAIWLRAMFLLQAYPVLFSRFYGQTLRRGWLEKRRYVFGVGMAMMLRRRLGMRKTKYRPVAGLDGEAVFDDESVSPDTATGALLGTMWKQMLAEMVGVSIVGGLLACFCCWMLLSRF